MKLQSHITSLKWHNKILYQSHPLAPTKSDDSISKCRLKILSTVKHIIFGGSLVEGHDMSAEEFIRSYNKQPSRILIIRRQNHGRAIFEAHFKWKFLL